MKLSRESLRAACHEVASQTMSARRPVDVASIEAVVQQFFDIALEYKDFVIGQGRDPDLIVRAVHYLADKHAIPPMRDDTRWFSDMLDVLIEIACPNCGTTQDIEAFLRDIEDGIAVGRSDSQLNQKDTEQS